MKISAIMNIAKKTQKENFKMKKTLSLILAIVLVVGVLFTLASCGNTLSGTYKAEGLISTTTYEFSGSKVTVKGELFGATISIDGTYKIEENEDGKLEITLDFGDEENAGEFAGTFSFSKGEENGSKYIKIAGKKYVKE